MNLDSPYNKRSIHADLNYGKTSHGLTWHGWGYYGEDGHLIRVVTQTEAPKPVAYGTWRKVKVSIVG